MKRGNGDHLTEREVEELHAGIRAGIRTPVLAARFGISDRTVCVHSTKLNGNAGVFDRLGRKRVENVVALCLVDGCYDKRSKGGFCGAHVPAPRVGSLIDPKLLMRGRA